MTTSTDTSQTPAVTRPRPAGRPGPDETVRHVHPARTEHPCDATGCPWCPRVIRPGEAYDLWTAFPTHTTLGGGYGSKPWQVRVCATCSEFFASNNLEEILDPEVTL